MTIRMNWQNLLSTQRFRTKNGEIVPTVTPSTQEGADALRTDFTSTTIGSFFPEPSAALAVKRRCIRWRNTI